MSACSEKAWLQYCNHAAIRWAKENLEPDRIRFAFEMGYAAALADTREALDDGPRDATVIGACSPVAALERQTCAANAPDPYTTPCELQTGHRGAHRGCALDASRGIIERIWG